MRMRFLAMQASRMINAPKSSAGVNRFSHNQANLPENVTNINFYEQYKEVISKNKELEDKLVTMRKEHRKLASNFGSLLFVVVGTGVCLAQSLFLNYLLYPEIHEAKSSEVQFRR